MFKFVYAAALLATVTHAAETPVAGAPTKSSDSKDQDKADN